jgi:hypothetical protein
MHTMNEISWQAPEFEHAPRTTRWYLWSLGILLLCIVVAFMQANLLFAIFVVVAAILVYVLGDKKPRMNLYVANADGVYLGREMLRSSREIDSFAVHDMGGRHVELVLRPSQKFHNYTRLLVPRERVEAVVAFLGERYPTFEYVGGMADVMRKHLGI